jgi:hypothetical protein
VLAPAGPDEEDVQLFHEDRDVARGRAWGQGVVQPMAVIWIVVLVIRQKRRPASAPA